MGWNRLQRRRKADEDIPESTDNSAQDTTPQPEEPATTAADGYYYMMQLQEIQTFD